MPALLRILGPQTRDGGHRWAATGTAEERGAPVWVGSEGMKRGHRGHQRERRQAEAADGTGPSQGCRQDRTRAEADGTGPGRGAAGGRSKEGERLEAIGG